MNMHIPVGDLEQGSPLELCYLLGKLREPGMLLDANDRAAAKAAKSRGATTACKTITEALLD